jgi:hypothetical protein
MNVRLWILSRELTRIRRERRLTDAKLKKGGVDPSGIRRWLSGETTQPRQSTVELLLNICNIHGAQRDELLDLALNPDGSAWLRTYMPALGEKYSNFIEFESDANRIRSAQPMLVPGLLQTEAYAEAVVRATPGATDEHVSRQLEVRAQRRAALARIQFHAVLDEAALRRQTGGPNVMRAQLLALLDLPSNVTLQVLPFTAGAHTAMTGSFVIMEFADPRAPRGVVAIESTGQLFVDSRLDTYERNWTGFAEAALEPQATATFIATAADELD